MALRGDAVTANLYVYQLLESVMKICFLLRQRYAPYRKWLFTAFQRLPDLPVGLIESIECVTTHSDLAMLEQRMNTLLDFVGTMANESGLIEPLPLWVESPFTWTNFNCYGFMQAIHQKLQGPLRNISPYAGPLDQWVSNHLPLSPAIMRASWQNIEHSPSDTKCHLLA